MLPSVVSVVAMADASMVSSPVDDKTELPFLLSKVLEELLLLDGLYAQSWAATNSHVSQELIFQPSKRNSGSLRDSKKSKIIL